MNAFLELQKQFSAYLRDPDNNPCPAHISPEKINVYRDLIYNTTEELISNAFPVIHSILKETLWHETIRKFLSEHEAKTPLFVEVPLEFIQFVSNHKEFFTDYPFIEELAHYEWIELELYLAEDEFSSPKKTTDLLTATLQVSPLARSCQYQYPVHKIGKDYIPQTTPNSPVFLLIHRNQLDKVKFSEINAVSARLIEIIQINEDITIEKVLKQVADELQHPEPQAVITHGLKTVEDLIELGVLYLARDELLV